MQADISTVLRGHPHPRFILVSDLDHTMVQNEDPTHERLQLFNRLWTAQFSRDSLLIFSTGRSPALFAELWDEAPLLMPDILICSVGTELFYRAADGKLLPDSRWEAELDRGWDRAKVVEMAARRPRLAPQPSSEQRRHKVSFHLQGGGSAEEDRLLLEGLKSDLEAAGLAAKVIYSGGVDVDVLAQGAGKGKALEFLLDQLRALGRWPADGVQVNGDSGNDAELFQVPGVHGCIVANAHKELLDFYHSHAAAAAEALAGVGGRGGRAPGPVGGVYLAQQPCAGGIVEALAAFGSLARAQQAAAAAAAPAASPSDAEGVSDGGGAVGATTAAAVLQALVGMAPLQTNALGGGLAALAAPGATWVTPSGALRAIEAGMEEPGDALAGGIVWIDDVSLRSLGNGSGGSAGVDGGTLVLATYQLLSFSGDRRDSGAVRTCSALLAAGAGGARLLHLQETRAALEVTCTHRIRELSRQRC